MDIIILAAGLGSRLSKYTHNIIPKYLVTIGNNTGLYHIINYWNKYTKKIYLVIHSKFNQITEFYIKNILVDFADKIEIINYDTSDGTAYTLNFILNNNLKDKISNDLCITWCDIFPKDLLEIPFINNNNNNNIFVFTNNCNCRYNLDENNKIVPSEINKGNIVGIYYFQNYKSFNLLDDLYNQDIVQFLDKIGNIYNYEINKIVDYGDENKLNLIINNPSTNMFNCRYFNNIKLLDNNKLLKTAINNKGQTIMEFEKNWYMYIQKNYNHIDFLPKIYETYETYENGFLMEYKEDYIPLYKYFNKNGFSSSILHILFNKIKILHELSEITIDKQLFLENLKIEIFNKVINRKESINPLLEYFGNIKTVNKVNIESFDTILNKCNQIIYKYYDNLNNNINIYKYNIIHGDCQFSNTLINNNNDIIFIDPRGYFGNSKIYGIKEYDYSKILYSLYGFDNFNANYFIIDSIDNESIQITIQTFFTEETNIFFKDVHKAFMIIIWLSFAEYVKNDISKCLAAYYYGLYLGTILFFTNDLTDII